jgi:hypothetical protein
VESPEISMNNKVNARSAAENAGQACHPLTTVKNRALTNMLHR